MNTFGIAVLAASDKTIDLAKSWGSLWGAVTRGWGGVLTAMTIIGVALVVFALVKWAWERRRGGGMQGSGPMWGALIPGIILIAPNLLIPLILRIFDFLGNIAVSVIRAATGQ